jgi:HEAT repeat protein
MGWLRGRHGVMCGLFLALSALLVHSPAQDGKSDKSEKGETDKDKLRVLLKDAKPAERLQAGLALLKLKDVAAVPVLIDLLAGAQPQQRKQIEEALHDLAGEWAPTVNLSNDDDVSRGIRRDAWAAWWKRTEGPALLDEFKKRTLSADDLKKLQTHIAKLGDESQPVREQAIVDLVAYGTVVVPLLRTAAKDADPKRKANAERCLKGIAEGDNRALPPAAARLVGLRKPAGAVPVLLAFLPSTEDENLIGEIHTALAAVAVKDGKVDAALVKALNDPLASRRTAAGVGLAKGGGEEQRSAVRKLFKDADANVRTRVTLAAAEAKDKEAVVALIDSLNDLPREQGELVQEALFQVAGDKGPDAYLGEDAASRKKASEAWAAWWKANSETADLGKLTSNTQGSLGYTLLVGVNQQGQGGVVMEVGRDKKTRWQIGGLQTPFDARMIGGNRVLICEYGNVRVTERDLKGNILWQAQGVRSNPIAAQRLSNGNTFITTSNELLEVDRSGKEVFRRNVQGQALSHAHKFASGEYIYLTQQGRLVRVDAKGAEIKSFQTQAGNMIGAMDVSPQGRILLANNNQASVMEVDATGKVLFQINVNVRTASWLPNGNILVASYNTQKVIEMDRSGRTVAEYQDGNRHYRARRR